MAVVALTGPLERVVPRNGNNDCPLITLAATLLDMNANAEDLSSLYDVVVVGGGAAGLSAALVLSRARRRVLVIDAGAPRNAPAAHMQGFLSRDGMPPADLLRVGRAEIVGYGAEIEHTSVERAQTVEGAFVVQLANGRTVVARRVIIATGLRDELPDIPGLRERWAKDVLHCPYCHGWEVRDQRLGVLIDGSSESVKYAQIVRQWSDEIAVFAPVASLSPTDRAGLAARGIAIVEGEVVEVRVGDDQLVGVAMADGRTISRDTLFLPPRFLPHNDLLADLGCDMDEHGWVTKDPTGLTTTPGVWVAGNVANPRAQVITAAGEGSAAAIALNADLVEEDIRHAIKEIQ
jgi:thioredoxin reductase